MPKLKKVLFLVPYPLHRAPSQRFRVELFFPYLDGVIDYQVQSFLDEETWTVLYQQGSALQKALGVLKGFLRRTKATFFQAPFYDYIFIHREAAPLGPPVFEFIISRIWRKKIIYDFDDAIWIPNTSKENRLASWLKAFWKVPLICRWSYKVSAGNEYLVTYARKHAKQVTLVPTCVNVEKGHNQLKEQETEKVTIGWTGSHSTMRYLERLLPVWQRLASEEGDHIDFAVISNKAPQFQIPRLQYIPWNEATEASDLLRLNIGVMPLETDAWSEGKCGFKLIQYMAMGIPAVADPVGVNKEIVDDGVNGYLCKEQEEWYVHLKELIHDVSLRRKMGALGRNKIVMHYSIQANAERFLGLFD